MLEDKIKATDWEATNEAIEEQVARESYLQWLRDNEMRKAVSKNPIIAIMSVILLLEWKDSVMTFESSVQPVVAVRAQLRARNIIIHTFIHMEVVDSNVAIPLLRLRHKLAKIIYVILQRSVSHSIHVTEARDIIIKGFLLWLRSATQFDIAKDRRNINRLKDLLYPICHQILKWRRRRSLYRAVAKKRMRHPTFHCSIAFLLKYLVNI